MLQRSAELARLVEAHRSERVVVCGMGGSSLAPLVLGRAYGAPLEVLDTTHPAALRRLEVDGALFVISSKSGSTVETRCHFDHLWDRTGKRSGAFLVITDPGSPLEQLAKERGIEAVAGEPTIGGRYSALSVFGLVPAALAGVDVAGLLARAEEMHDACRLADGNPGLELGLELGAGWDEGRDKVVFENPGGFGLWLEQLIAESTGKEGRGLVPAAGESSDGPDRQHVEIEISAPDDLGAEFFRFELATAVAGAILGVNPFDQPDVEEAKAKTQAILHSGHVPGTVPRDRSRRDGGVAARAAFGRGTTSRSRRSSIPSASTSSSRSSSGLARPAASSRWASARAISTPRDSCTRAARRPGISSRSSTTWARMCPSRSGSSASAASSRRRLRETTRP